LHLNLPGVPEGSAFQPEPVMSAVDRGIPERPPESGTAYAGFTDMSGGSNDDATLAIGHRDADERVVVDLVMKQGPPPPFDPRLAVERFAEALRRYRLGQVTGDRFAGGTFKADFERLGIAYKVSAKTKHQLYEALEAPLNGGQVRLVDVPLVEQQLLGLVWRKRQDRPPGLRVRRLE
jgi:hypothetical protein